MPQPLRLIADRVISGVGLLRVPSEVLLSRYYLMYVDVIRKPRNQYLNLEWNPQQGLYARMTYLRKGYVQSCETLQYLRSQRIYINDISGQNLRALKAAYDGLLRLIAASTNPSQPVNINVVDIKDYESLALGWDEVRFACYADTALQVRLYAKDYDTGNPDWVDTDSPPAPPPALPEVPSGTPIGSISEPYNDDVITKPYGTDTVPKITDGTQDNNAYAIVYRIYGKWGDPSGNTPGKGSYKDFGREVWGRIYALVTNTVGTPYVGIDCHGEIAEGYGQRRTIIAHSGVPPSGFPPAEILRIEPR